MPKKSPNPKPLVQKPFKPSLTDRLARSERDRLRYQRKAAAANDTVTALRIENARLTLDNRMKAGFLSSETSNYRKLVALEERFALIQEITSDHFPTIYGSNPTSTGGLL